MRLEIELRHVDEDPTDDRVCQRPSVEGAHESLAVRARDSMSWSSARFITSMTMTQERSPAGAFNARRAPDRSLCADDRRPARRSAAMTSAGEIILADNLDVLPRLADRSFQLIYIDPPFNTGKTQQRARRS